MRGRGQAALNFDQSQERDYGNPGTPPNLAPHSPTFLAASIPSHLIFFFLENCGKILRSFCFYVEVHDALEMTFNGEGERMPS